MTAGTEQDIGKKEAEVQAITFAILFGFDIESKLMLFKYPRLRQTFFVSHPLP